MFTFTDAEVEEVEDTAVSYEREREEGKRGERKGGRRMKKRRGKRRGKRRESTSF